MPGRPQPVLVVVRVYLLPLGFGSASGKHHPLYALKHTNLTSEGRAMLHGGCVVWWCVVVMLAFCSILAFGAWVAWGGASAFLGLRLWRLCRLADRGVWTSVFVWLGCRVCVRGRLHRLVSSYAHEKWPMAHSRRPIQGFRVDEETHVRGGYPKRAASTSNSGKRPSQDHSGDAVE